MRKELIDKMVVDVKGVRSRDSYTQIKALDEVRL